MFSAREIQTAKPFALRVSTARHFILSAGRSLKSKLCQAKSPQAESRRFAQNDPRRKIQKNKVLVVTRYYKNFAML